MISGPRPSKTTPTARNLPADTLTVRPIEFATGSGKTGLDRAARAVAKLVVRHYEAVPELRVAVIASHAGSNLRALHRVSLGADAHFRIVLVISNNSDSGALRYARDNAIPARHLSGRTHDDPDEAIRAALVEHSAELVVTAGYLKKVGPRTRAEFSGRIINVHPALLPRHGGPGMYGEYVHRAVLDAGDPVSGASVHLVSDDYDTGQVIGRLEVPVRPGDTAQTLGARVLDAEHTLLPDVVGRIAAGRPGLRAHASVDR